MIEQQGQVVAVDGNQASVRLGGRSGCAACEAGKGCGAGVFGQLLRRKPVQMKFANTIEAECGQAVIVGMPEAVLLRLVTRFYLAPLLAGLVGGVAAYFLASRFGATTLVLDLVTLGAAILAGGLVLKSKRAGKAEFSEASAVHLLRVVGIQETKKRNVCD